MARVVAYLVPVATIAGILVGDALGAGPAAELLGGSLGLGLVATATRSRSLRCWMLVGAVAMLGCSVERRALDGLSSGGVFDAATARASAVVSGTVADDPDGSRWSTRVLLRVDSARVDTRRGTRAVREHRTVFAVADGDASGRVAVLAAGDRVVLRGWLRPLDGFDTRYRWRHAVARLEVLELIDATRSTDVLSGTAERARGFVLRGTDLLGPTERALVAGFLLGDTRDLPDDVLEHFRSSGLSHLLAVSGANVAFVLALVGPLLRRSSRAVRLIVTIAILVIFGAMTRWEPSVLRACAMAATAVLAAHVGRPAQGVRTLALAATLLLLVDPFLLRSVGFQLSCGASLGIAVLAGRVERRLRGPEWFRASVGTTVAAQLGVAPVLLPVFGSIPLVALPANLLAVPLAGPLTTWGLTGGVVAGMVRSRAPELAGLLQLPTRVLAEALLGLADLAASVPASIGATEVVELGVAVVVGFGGRAAWRAARRMLRERALVVPSR